MAQAMTADRIVFYSCVALWAVAMLVVSDQMGAWQVADIGASRKEHSPAPVSAPTNSLTASDLAALLSRCLDAALSDGPDSPAFIYTDPFTEQRLEIYCDAQPALKVASYERRHIQ